MERDVVIIGGGVIGASILYYLSKNGYNNAALIEKSHFACGSTAKSGGFIRVYHSNPLLTEMSMESFSSFKNFEQEIGRSCGYIKTGLLHLIPDNQVTYMLDEVKKLQQQYEYSIEALTINEAKKLFPSLSFDGVGAVAYEPEGGFADPVLTTKAWIDAARSLGAIAMEGTEVTDIVLDNEKVVGVNTTAGFIQAKAVILATGAWSSTFIQQLQLNYRIRSKSIQIQFVKRPEEALMPPAFIDNTTELFSRPDTHDLVLVGYPTNQWDINPDDVSAMDYDETLKVNQIAKKRFQWFDNSTFSGGRLSFDGYTNNEVGILEEVSGLKGLIISAGWSGGGYKLSPAVGQRTVKLIKEMEQ
ncbi:FAD-binding oxidoreductase [Cytobacillus sp. IB215316]|uniref:NAD(P)/FAD-dependent oxidoreductase n=1 Tax=Cytobacillus sp. IB215316 TaxID=3097354 RepID=UPI002A0E9708|nr:FAD-binding oxidoreductase [Cytobacillus sp. IB215316]MDX8360983.1 FAD-binding oxidoreductase [Cytobacillus sp. IB215316]